MTQSTYYSEGESSEAIKADIERTRHEMSNKIDTIQERLNPETLKVQAQDAIRTAMSDGANSLVEYMRGHSSELGVSLIDTVKRNPIPAALIGVGIGWLLLDSMKDPSSRTGNNNGWRTAQSGAYSGGYSEQNEASYYGSEMGYATGAYGSSGSADSSRERYPYSDEREKGIGQQVRDKVGQVTSTVRHKVGEIAEQVSDKASELTDQVRSSAHEWGDEAAHKAGRYGAQAQDYSQKAGAQVQTVIEDNVIAVSAAALVAGAMLGLVLPATRRENEMLGEWRDQVVEKAQNVAGDVVQRAQEVVQEAKSDAQQIAANVVDELAQSGKEAISGAQANATASLGQKQNANATNPGITSPASSTQKADKVAV